MSKDFAMISTLLSFLIITYPSYAAESDSTSAAESLKKSSNLSAELSKEEWLKSVIPMIPNMICKEIEKEESLKKRLSEINMTAEKCLNVIPDSISKCQKELYESIPDKINADTAAIWGKSLGVCIGKDFASKYFSSKQK